MRSNLLVALFCVLAAACARRGSSETGAGASAAVPASAPAQMSAPTQTSAAAPAQPAGSELTGVLSEEEFKKLHELRTDQAPPRRGSDVQIAGRRAYLSLPPGANAPLPGVVVIHEWWGMNDHMLHWADRLAAEGYAALAVDLYEGKVATTPDSAMQYMKAVDAGKAKATLLAGHEFLVKDVRVKAPRTGVIGWCFGGKWSLELALAAPDLDAAVVYYGQVTTDPARLKALKTPLLGIFANNDKAIPPPMVDQFEKGLKAANVESRILRYDADHAFANPSGQRYDQKSAEQGWREVRAFLAKRLEPAAR